MLTRPIFVQLNLCNRKTNKMKKKILFLLILVSALSVRAQQKTCYSYDNAGNRISQNVILISISSKSLSQSTDSVSQQKISSSLLICNVTVYPNPTKGVLSISITEIAEDAVSGIALYNSSGQLLKKMQVIGNSTFLIDISSYANGIYLIDFKQGESHQLYKIIKE